MHTIRVLIRSSKVMYYFPKNNNIFALIFHFTPPYKFIADYQSLTAIKLFSHFSTYRDKFAKKMPHMPILTTLPTANSS